MSNLVQTRLSKAPPPRVASWLAEPLKAHLGTYLQVAVAAAIINLFSLATAIFAMVIYDRVVPNNAMESLVALSIGMGFIFVFDFILKFVRGYLIDFAGHSVDRDLGATLFQSLLNMRMESRKGSAGALAGLLRELETLRDFFASATLATIVDAPFILLFLIIIWSVGGSIVWVPLAAVPLVIILALILQPTMVRLSAMGMEEGLSKQGVLVETITALEAVKATAAGPLLAGRWADAVEQHASISMRQRLMGAIAINAAGAVQQIAFVATIILGVILIGRQDLTMGGLIACSMLTSRCLAPLSQIAFLLTRISNTRAAYRQLNELMQLGGEIDAQSAYIRRATINGAIEFRNVSFKYPGSNIWALQGASFRIEPGEKVAILGRIGSGKSTIARLILGLYEPTEGLVLIDDTDVRQIHPDDLRQNIGAVLQDVQLLSGTMRENLTLGDPHMTDEEILRVAKLSGVHDFVGKIPNGYDMRLADRGEGISGGQRQAIAIARALTGNRQILLLDEPTSAMDIQTENTLIGRLGDAFKDQTIMLVTHRSSMVELVDRIILVDQGKIIGFGPRDSVLKSVAAGAR